MKNKSILLCLVAFLMTFLVFTGVISAQNVVDVEGMDNEQLTTLLLQIMQRLDGSGEAAEMPEPTATPTPEPAKTPQPELSSDTAELEALLTAIMQKLQQEEPNDVPEKSAGVSIPAGDPGEEAVNSIWEDKKLIIEALPGYMFIQPTEEEPNNNDVTPSEDKPKHYNNEPDIDEYGVDCHWYFVHGEWLCMYG